MNRLLRKQLCEGKIYMDILSKKLVQPYLITNGSVTAQYYNDQTGRLDNMFIQDGQLTECEETKIPLDVSED